MPKQNQADKEEQDFQAGIKKTEWFKEYVKEYGEEPDLNTKDYDYRSAWKAGVRPQRDPYDKNRYHWSSSNPETGEMLKSKEHPTAWKEEYMKRTGKNPDEVGVTKEQAGMNKGGAVVKGLMRNPQEDELDYFKKNPTVTGMATDDNRIILNPFSKLTDREKELVALNEAARIKMRTDAKLAPNFELTPEQSEFLNSNTYKQASDADRKATIAARILTGDPSAGTPTEEQTQFVDKLRQSFSSTEEPEKMNKGGAVKAKLQTKKLLQEGGMLQEGGTVDPVSGNDVPVGSMQEEVRDDIPAKLSEGEFVFPADVVRYIGLERLMQMRQAAKEGLQKMEAMGQMSNADEATEEDTGEFESQLDEIFEEIEGEGKEKEEETEMQVGGMAVPQQEQAAMPEGMTQEATAPKVPKLTPEQLQYINQTAEEMQAKEPELASLPPSNPTEGLTPTNIIKANFGPDKQQEADQFIQKVEKLTRAKRAINIRHNDTVIVGFVKRPGVLDPFFFSNDTPDKLDEAVTTGIEVAKKAGIKTLE